MVQAASGRIPGMEANGRTGRIMNDRQNYYGIWFRTPEGWLEAADGTIFNTPDPGVAKATFRRVYGMQRSPQDRKNISIRIFGQDGFPLPEKGAIEDLPLNCSASLRSRIVRGLPFNGVHYIEDLRKLSDREILSMHNIGVMCLTVIRAALEKYEKKGG